MTHNLNFTIGVENKNKKYLVFDTETAGGFSNPLVYDIGGAIVDRHGNVYHTFHYVIKEVFADLSLMRSAYYADKFRSYIQRIYEQDIEPVELAEVLDELAYLIEKYNVKAIAAYNELFDENAMTNTARTYCDCAEWLSPDIPRMCIYHAACDLLYKRDFLKACAANNWFTEKGNPQTSAEIGYRYISGDLDFVEEHKGLDDVLIESAILAEIFKRKKTFDATPIHNTWKIVANRLKKN